MLTKAKSESGFSGSECGEKDAQANRRLMQLRIRSFAGKSGTKRTGNFLFSFRLLLSFRPRGKIFTYCAPSRYDNTFCCRPNRFNYSMFWTCSRICSMRTRSSTDADVVSPSTDLALRVLASLCISCMRKSRRRPTGFL